MDGLAVLGLWHGAVLLAPAFAARPPCFRQLGIDAYMTLMPHTTCPQCAYTRSEQDSNPAWQCPKCGVAYTKAQRDKTRRKPYIPNSIPGKVRLINLSFGLGGIVYGVYGLHRNDLFIPSRRGPGTHLHDGAAMLMVAAIACGCAVLLSVVLDHYDERNNEAHYQRAAQVLRWLAWIFVFLSFGRHFVR